MDITKVYLKIFEYALEKDYQMIFKRGSTTLES